jgi:hypothetical protein
VTDRITPSLSTVNSDRTCVPERLGRICLDPDPVAWPRPRHPAWSTDPARSKRTPRARSARRELEAHAESKTEGRREQRKRSVHAPHHGPPVRDEHEIQSLWPPGVHRVCRGASPRFRVTTTGSTGRISPRCSRASPRTSLSSTNAVLEPSRPTAGASFPHRHGGVSELVRICLDHSRASNIEYLCRGYLAFIRGSRVRSSDGSPKSFKHFRPMTPNDERPWLRLGCELSLLRQAVNGSRSAALPAPLTRTYTRRALEWLPRERSFAMAPLSGSSQQRSCASRCSASMSQLPSGHGQCPRLARWESRSR